MGKRSNQNQNKTLLSKKNASNEKRHLEFWVSVFAIIAGIVAVIGLFPTLYTFIDNLRDKIFQRNLLSIDESSLSLGGYETQIIPLPSNQDPATIHFKTGKDYKENLINYGRKCLGKQKDCIVYIFPELLSTEQFLDLKISSRAKESPPLTIEGIEVKLLDYRSIESNPIEAIHTPGRGGGGGGWTYFDLDNFPHRDTFNGAVFSPNEKSSKWLLDKGSEVLVKPECRDKTENCSPVLYLAPNEVEGLRLNLALLNSVAPGWYEFEVSIKFARSGKSYASRQKIVFDVIKPQKLHLWYGNANTLKSGITNIDFDKNKVESIVTLPSSNGFTGQLIFKTDLGIEYFYYLWDMKTGAINQIGDLNSSPSFLMSLDDISPNGWKGVYDTLFDDLIIKDTGGWDVDLNVVDFRSSNIINITPGTPNSREVMAKWSPSGNKIAYIRISREATNKQMQGSVDIFTYNVQTGKTNQITNSPLEVESQVEWISETELAVRLSKEGVFISGKPTGNTRVGIEIINLENGQTRMISQIDKEIKYYSAKNMLRIGDSTFYEITNQSITDKKSPKDCELLNSSSWKYICTKYDDHIEILIYDSDKGQEDLLFTLNKKDRYEDMMNWLVVGQVKPSGFMIIDVEKEIIHQYSDEGKFIRSITIPQLSKVFSWLVNDAIMIDESTNQD